MAATFRSQVVGRATQPDAAHSAWAAVSVTNVTAGNAMIHGLIVVDLEVAEGVLFADGFESGSAARWSHVGS